MTKISIIIDKEGNVKTDYQNFTGDECFFEAEKLHEILQTLGVNVEIKEIQKKDSDVQTQEQEKAKNTSSV